MTIEELRKKLINNKVPEHMYSLLVGGFPNETFCLVKEGNLWEVYYSERGNKRGAKQFEKEEEACEYMDRKLRKYATNN